MYYIVNHTQHIIAADSNLLKLLSAANIDELYTKIALGDIEITSSDVDVSIKVEDETLTYKKEIHSLSGILGNITLVEIYPSEEDEDSSSFIIEDDEPFTIFDDNKSEELTEKISLDDEPFNLILDENNKAEEKAEEKSNDEVLFDDDLFDLDNTKDDENKITLDDEPFELISNDEESIKTTENKIIEVDNKISFDDDIFDLVSDVDESKKDEEEKIEKLISFDDEPFELMSDSPQEVNNKKIKDEKTKDESSDDIDSTPITLDAAKISQNIGISTDDYNTFLNEYIDTAFTFEKDLAGEKDDKRLHAITTLSHLSNVLNLPMITDIIEEIRDASSDKRDISIKSLYATLARLSTTGEAPVNNTTIAKDIEEPETTPEESAIDDLIETNQKDISNDNIIEDLIIEDEIVENEKVVEEPVEEETVEESAVNPNGFGTIDLSDVKPIHFDFQMEAAASDLSLPVELIEEFVNDFIEQAHEETEKMLKCYEEGDLDAIQKIGHLLKGTASNLRINPLADTLYEIQFCEDSSNLEKLIKEYWGHFLSFETQIKLISK